MPRPSEGRLPAVLLAVFALIWTALAIAPWYRQDWALENVLVAVGVAALVARHRRHPFSDRAYVLLFCFGVLHEIGAHYTYAEVPYDRWVEALSGRGLNDWLDLQRNHFDRLVHFLYGLLLFRPAQELLCADGSVRGWRAWLFPLSVLAAGSMLFELFEWAAAEVFGGDLGQAYLGTQGDIWDAHKDMALALLGSLLTAAALGIAGRGAAAGDGSVRSR